MVVLKQHNRVGDVLNLLKHRLRKLPVYGLVVLPVGGAEDRPRVRNMAEWPKTLIGKSVVVTFFLIFGEPHAMKSVVWIIRRNSEPVMLIDG